MEALFGYAAADQKKQKRKESSTSESTPQFIQIIDPKKAQNLAILLKALNVTSEEVCDALTEGVFTIFDNYFTITKLLCILDD